MGARYTSLFQDLPVATLHAGMDRGRVFSNKSDIMRMVVGILEEERVDYSLPASKGGQVGADMPPVSADEPLRTTGRCSTGSPRCSTPGGCCKQPGQHTYPVAAHHSLLAYIPRWIEWQTCTTCGHDLT